jgi:hypothetical protein
MLLESESDNESDNEVEEEFPVLQQQQQQAAKTQPLNYSRLINMTEEETKEAIIKKAEGCICSCRPRASC